MPVPDTARTPPFPPPPPVRHYRARFGALVGQAKQEFERELGQFVEGCLPELQREVDLLHAATLGAMQARGGAGRGGSGRVGGT